MKTKGSSSAALVASIFLICLTGCATGEYSKACQGYIRLGGAAGEFVYQGLGGGERPNLAGKSIKGGAYGGGSE